MHLLTPHLLTKHHQTADFDCGDRFLNGWLKKTSIKNKHLSKTYVTTHKDEVIGYYTLSLGGIGQKRIPRLNSTAEVIPALILNRLAVHKDYHNQGIGKALLKDAVLRSFHASQIAGISTLLVYALSERAKRFYVSNGFFKSCFHPHILCL